MNWSEGEAAVLWRVHDEAETEAHRNGFEPTSQECQRRTSRAVAGTAAELLAARGGTMSAARIARVFNWRILASERGEILRHITAQGARIAALEAEVVRVQGRADGLDVALGDRTKSYQQASAEAGRLQQHISELEKSLARADTERDEWRASAEHVGQALVSATRERDAAVADNAALLGLIEALHQNFAGGLNGKWTPDLARSTSAARIQPHPGAALLERHREEVASARAAAWDEAIATAAEEAAALILSTNRLTLVEVDTIRQAIIYGASRGEIALRKRADAHLPPRPLKDNPLLERMRAMETALTAIHDEGERYASDPEQSKADTVERCKAIASEALAGRYSHPAGPAVVERLKRLEEALANLGEDGWPKDVLRVDWETWQHLDRSARQTILAEAKTQARTLGRAVQICMVHVLPPVHPH